jgi:hypothetical protein
MPRQDGFDQATFSHSQSFTNFIVCVSDALHSAQFFVSLAAYEIFRSPSYRIKKELLRDVYPPRGGESVQMK